MRNVTSKSMGGAQLLWTLCLLAMAAATSAYAQSGILSSPEARENDANREAGVHERKSVSFVPVLLSMDRETRSALSKHSELIVNLWQEKLVLPRFDQNTLPHTVVAGFLTQVNRKQQLNDAELTHLTETVLVPKILEIADLEKKSRALGYATSQQRQSFFASKAKELGITDVELARVMNSAYIFLPVARNFSLLRDDSLYSIQVDFGVLLYHVSTEGEKSRARLIGQYYDKTSKSSATVRQTVCRTCDKYSCELKANATQCSGKWEQYYPTYTCGDGDNCSVQAHLLWKHSIGFASSLDLAVRNISEFQLSAQVIQAWGGGIRFRLGQEDGVRVNDRFLIMESVASQDGSIRQTRSGWVIVSNVKEKANGSSPPLATARVVSGRPMLGSVLAEYPVFPFSLVFGFQSVPDLQPSRGRPLFSNGMGLHAKVRADIGRKFDWPQLFTDVGLGVGLMGEADERNRLEFDPEYRRPFFANWDISLHQRFFLRRLLVGVEAGLAGRHLIIGDSSRIDPYVHQDLIVGDGWLTEFSPFLGTSLGFALGPNVNLDFGARLHPFPGFNRREEMDNFRSTTIFGGLEFFSSTARSFKR